MTILFLLISILLLSSAGEAITKECVQLRSGLLIDLPTAQEINPGAFASYIFRVENYSSQKVSLKVVSASNSDLLILGGINELELVPGAVEYLAVSLMTPTSATAGTEFPLTITFTSEGETKEATILTKIKALHHLELITPEKVTGQAGEVAKVQALLTNKGSVTEEVFCSVSFETWESRCQTPQLSLAPGESQTTEIHCQIPHPSPIGAAQYLYLTVDSGQERIERRIMVLVSHTTEPDEIRYLTIPLETHFNLGLSAPHKGKNLTWQSGLQMAGSLTPNIKLHLYLAGERTTENLFLPSAAYLGVTGKNQLVKIGDFDANWEGLITAPSSRAVFYLQNKSPFLFRLWLGSQESAFATPSWYGWSLGLSDSIKLNYLHPNSVNALFTDSFDLTIQPGAEHLWPDSELFLRGGIGFGASDPLGRGEISFLKTESTWSFTGSIKTGNEFYVEEAKYGRHFTEALFSSEWQINNNLALKPGFKIRWRHDLDPKSDATKSPCAVEYWNKLLWGQNYLYFKHSGRPDTVQEVETGLTKNLPGKKVSANIQWNPNHSLILQGKSIEKLSLYDSVESYFSYKQLKAGDDYLIQPGFGVKWSFRLNHRLESNGALHILSPLTPGVCYSMIENNWGYQYSPFSSFHIGGKFLWGLDTTQVQLGVYLQHHGALPITVPWGSLQGRIFYDRNLNGRYDQGEQGISGVEILVDGKKTAVTDENGLFSFTRLKVGAHQVSINPKTQFFSQAEEEVVIEPNILTLLDLAVLPPLDIKGLIFVDNVNRSVLSSQRRVLPGVSLILYNVETNQKIAETISEDDGAFFFREISPGRYRLEAQAETLPTDCLTPAPLEVQIAPGAQTISFPLSAVEKEIEFTFME